jgi:hypothetical protein
MEIFQVADNSANAELKILCEKILQKERKLPKSYAFIQLYKNYFDECKKILQTKKNCIIDHNIFLDPYPDRKNIFFKCFLQFGKKFKILRLFNCIESTLVNLLNRNNLFYDFVFSHSSGKQASREAVACNTQKGFSFLAFRQPLRLIENWAAMYSFTLQQPLHGTVMQQISGRNFQRALNVAHTEQEKLLGILCFKGYPVTHVPNPQLIHLAKEHSHLLQLSSQQSIYIQDKRFEWDYSVKIDNDLNSLSLSTKYKKIMELVKAWPAGKETLDLREEGVTALGSEILRKREEKLQRLKKITLPSTCPFIPEDNTSQTPHAYLINSLKNTKKFSLILDGLLSKVISEKYPKKIIYPVSNTQYACATVFLGKDSDIKIDVFFEKENEEAISCTFIFLGNLYAAFKSCKAAHHHAINTFIISEFPPKMALSKGS